jgi:hypothetical protein
MVINGFMAIPAPDLTDARSAGWSVEQQQGLTRLLGRLRDELDWSAIWQMTAADLRQLLAADRVGVVRWDADSSGTGQIVAEAVAGDWVTPLSRGIQAHGEGRYRTLLEQTGAIANTTDPCGSLVLEQHQIRACVTAPLLNGTTRWGELYVHQCSGPRHWLASEVTWLSHVADTLGVALQQTERFQQTRAQAQALTGTLAALHQSQTRQIQGETLAGLGQLVAGIAHEINNPINFIYGNLCHVNTYTQELLDLLALYCKHYPAPVPAIQQAMAAIDLEFTQQDLPKTLAAIQTGTDRIRRIILSLRNFAHLDESEKKVVDLHEGLDNTLLILQHRFRQIAERQPHGIQVKQCYGALPRLECYPAQMNQVFMNLISNAIDALEERMVQAAASATGTAAPETIFQITITTGLEPPYGVIRIADNGPGIEAAVRSQLFTPFFTTKPIGKGAGLGLSMSYQIVTEKHQGELTCCSTPGKGAEFVIKLPMTASS